MLYATVFSDNDNTNTSLVYRDAKTNRVLCQSIQSCVLDNWPFNNPGDFPRFPLIKCCVPPLLDKRQHVQDWFRPANNM